MTKEVVLTPLAEKNYRNVIFYLFENWGSAVMNDFMHRFDVTCEFIANAPELYPSANVGKRVRKCVVTKHNIIYFRVNKTNIKVLMIFDTRQNPKKLRSLL